MAALRSAQVRGVTPSVNCRVCTSDLADAPSWADSSGHRYCANCLEDLRKQPPYQSPLFACTSCDRAWPLRALTRKDAELVCRHCQAGTPPPNTSRKRPAGAESPPPRRTSGPNPVGVDAGIAGKPPVKAVPSSPQAPWGPLGPPPSSVLPRITCPHCWHVFPIDELLWVSRHAELLGDPVLGADAPLRFRPSRFTAGGDALDARDNPCQVLACPRCHLTIPRAMTQLPPLYVSLIGAPASGKSYFLASMAWEMRRLMRDRFGVSFTDADALFNQSLHENEETLFLSHNPDALVSIRKTELQGAMYDQIRLGEQIVQLPKPLLFTMRSTREREGSSGTGSSQTRMMCLYDNAGEHYQPGMDTVSMPGTQHLAKSRVLWFLFDPTQNARFREQCRSLSQDPQLRGLARTQRQEVLLNEAADRIRRYSGLGAGEKHDRPLIVLVSKADIWSQLLGVQLSREPLATDPGDRSLSAVDVDRVEKVSAGLRELLFTLTPEFVAAAEDFCRHVVYIPVSALGRGPEIDDHGSLGIRPRDIQPQWVTVPALYMLAKWANGWIPGVHTDVLADADATPAVRPSPAASPRAILRVPPPTEQSNYELFYTSAQRGLRSGSSGFCTVAATGGIPQALVERLEILSGFDPPRGESSTAFVAHWRIPVGTRRWSVLSRIVPAGHDYSGRANKLAYHFVLASTKLPAGGPAWLIRQPGVMPNQCPDTPRTLPATKSIPNGDSAPRPCVAWESLTGDAGWAGILAESLLLDPLRVCYVVHPAGADPLALLDEALALLPPVVRWEVTFCTAAVTVPVDLTCNVRFVSASDKRTELPASDAGSCVIDISTRRGAPDTEAARCARTGTALASRRSGGHHG